MRHLKKSAGRVRQRGFSLIEILLAIALGALIMVAAGSMLLSLTQIWVQEEDLDDVQDHMHGVTSFIRSATHKGFFQVHDSLPKPSLVTPPNYRGKGQVLSFLVKTPSPLIWDEHGLVRCYLIQKAKEGLFLRWHNFYRTQKLVGQRIEGETYRRSVPIYRNEPMYERLLSPWVTEVNYGNFPENIEITFEKDEEEYKTWVYSADPKTIKRPII